MKKPILNEKFADNGEHSHWELIDANTGEVLWGKIDAVLPQANVSGSTYSEDDAWYDPEECENCVEQMEADGIEYTKDFTWENGTWVCDHCGMPQ